MNIDIFFWVTNGFFSNQLNVSQTTKPIHADFQQVNYNSIHCEPQNFIKYVWG